MYAQNSSFRQRKEEKINAKFFRTHDFTIYKGAAILSAVYHPDSGASRDDPEALAGKDVLATAQTGTGKTLAFLIPIMEHLLQNEAAGIAALVLVPTRELAMQVAEQYNALRGKRLGPAALVVGGLPEAQQLTALRKGARLVVATPGRLEDYLGRQLISFRALRILILDEADRMLDMGFLPAIRRIVAAVPKDRQTMCFSATLAADGGTPRKRLHAKPRAAGLRVNHQARQKTCASRPSKLPTIANRKSSALARPGDGPLPGVRAHQARHRAAGKESDSPRICCGHDSW